jgi:hypothetical protein
MVSLANYNSTEFHTLIYHRGVVQEAHYRSAYQVDSVSPQHMNEEQEALGRTSRLFDTTRTAHKTSSPTTFECNVAPESQNNGARRDNYC